MKGNSNNKKDNLIKILWLTETFIIIIFNIYNIYNILSIILSSSGKNNFKFLLNIKKINFANFYISLFFKLIILGLFLLINPLLILINIYIQSLIKDDDIELLLKKNYLRDKSAFGNIFLSIFFSFYLKKEKIINLILIISSIDNFSWFNSIKSIEEGDYLKKITIKKILFWTFSTSFLKSAMKNNFNFDFNFYFWMDIMNEILSVILFIIFFKRRTEADFFCWLTYRSIINPIKKKLINFINKKINPLSDENIETNIVFPFF